MEKTERKLICILLLYFIFLFFNFDILVSKDRLKIIGLITLFNSTDSHRFVSFWVIFYWCVIT